MKLESKFFDSIRIAARKEDEAPPQAPGCQWKGCACPGTHRAPRDRGRDGRYFLFCIDHVRQFNATYNYFSGMTDEEVEAFQKSAIIGHRPTWRLGENGTAARVEEARTRRSRGDPETADPHDLLGKRRAAPPPEGEPPRRVLRTLEKKALDQLHLAETATRDEIKARFKMLVKRHHPDANGGDRASEEKLREIIQAYNYLKAAGLV